MKYAEGYTQLGWSILSLALLGGFVYLLGRALEVLPVGTAYAIWTGIVAVGSWPGLSAAWFLGDDAPWQPLISRSQS